MESHEMSFQNKGKWKGSHAPIHILSSTKIIEYLFWKILCPYKILCYRKLYLKDVSMQLHFDA